MKNKLIQAKNYVVTHKKTVVVVAGLATIVLLQNTGIKRLNGFLADHDLFNEYYHNGEL